MESVRDGFHEFSKSRHRSYDQEFPHGKLYGARGLLGFNPFSTVL